MLRTGLLFAAFAAFFAAVLPATSTAWAIGPHQPGVLHYDVEVCKPYYPDDIYQQMTQVVEVPEARERFPASYLYVPKDGASHPGVVWLHGSEGGRYSALSTCDARLLATQGYAALFFCYSDCGDDRLPEAIYGVDLQRTEAAMAWLKSSPYVSGKRVALSGGSRGAEQTLVLASFLAKKAQTDASIVQPDAIFAHAPWGKTVGAFNWRWERPARPDEFRWDNAMWFRRNCLQADANGPYSYREDDGQRVQMSWKYGDARCTDKPALTPDECWNGTTWLEDLCGVAPAADDRDPYQLPAWSWGGSQEGLEPGTDIPLEAYQGPILVTQGTEDEIWPVDGGALYLMQHLDAMHTLYNPIFYAPLAAPEKPASPLPVAPTDRIVFGVFSAEGHGFGRGAAMMESSLELSFLGQHLTP